MIRTRMSLCLTSPRRIAQHLILAASSSRLEVWHSLTRPTRIGISQTCPLLRMSPRSQDSTLSLKGSKLNSPTNRTRSKNLLSTQVSQVSRTTSLCNRSLSSQPSLQPDTLSQPRSTTCSTTSSSLVRIPPATQTRAPPTTSSISRPTTTVAIGAPHNSFS
jgi:hypothetical protein